MPSDYTVDAREQLLAARLPLTEKQWDAVKQNQAENRLGLLQNAVKLGYVSETQAIEIQSEVFGLSIINLKHKPPDPQALSAISHQFQKSCQILPVAKTGSVLTVATSFLKRARPFQSQLQRVSGCLINFALILPTELEAYWNPHTAPDRSLPDSCQKETSPPIAKNDTKEDDKEKVKEVSLQKPEAKTEPDLSTPPSVLTKILEQVVLTKATDLHLDPLPDSCRVRYRHNGKMIEAATVDKNVAKSWIDDLRNQSTFQETKTNEYQAGILQVTVSDRIVTFRFVVFSTLYGDKIVLRSMETLSEPENLNTLFPVEEERQTVERLFNSKRGLVVCAGPAACGKTATLYSLLSHLNNPAKHIVAVDSSHPYSLPGISQLPSHRTNGVTRPLERQSLRHLDPDILAIGEVTDPNLMKFLCQTAHSKCLVMTTLEAGSLSETFERLLELAQEPPLAASALRAIIYQCLARTLCPHCKESYAPSDEELRQCGYGDPYPQKLYRSVGCQECDDSGVKSKIAVTEFVEISRATRDRILQGKTPSEILSHHTDKRISLEQDARRKLSEGFFTVEEFFRIIPCPTQLGEIPKPKAA